MKKIYYALKLKQESPLHLSNGDNQISDSDLMKDGRGMPFVPGTGLAGALRDMLTQSEGDALFGCISGKKIQESRVIIPDAVLPAKARKDQIRLTYRDGVGLEDFRGTAMKTAKYDFEVAETELPYLTCLEWTGEAEDATADILEQLMRRAAAEGIRLGSKKSRGYGRMRAEVMKKTFDFPEDLSAWLEFEPTSLEGEWSPVTGEKGNSDQESIVLDIEIAGAVAVRVYSTEPDGADYAPMVNMKGQPVIPGTSWAGSFRHRMRNLARELAMGSEDLEEIDRLFGKEKNDIVSSGISFSETEIHGGASYQITRNALDRFTSGPAMSALYTAGYWQGGKGTLEIQWKKDRMSDRNRQLLLAAIRDLELGLMTVGGNAATGLGRVRILQMHGEGMTE